MTSVTFERTQTYPGCPIFLGEGKQPSSGSQVHLEKAGSHDHQGLHFGEDERTSNPSL